MRWFLENGVIYVKLSNALSFVEIKLHYFIASASVAFIY